MSNTRYDAIIIGGGVIGLSCAYYLQREGLKVLVLDQSKVGDTSGTSYGNCGMIVPSHFMPLAAPGVLKQGLTWLLDRKSPLYIEPRASMALLGWLLRFTRSSTQKHVDRSASLIRDLNLNSKALYGEIALEESLDFGLSRKGIVMMCLTEKMMREELEVSHRAEKLEIPTEILDAQGLTSLESDVSINATGGVLYPKDAHLAPATFMTSLVSLLQTKGVELVGMAAVTDFEMTGNKVKAIITANQRYEADEIVLASGAWSGQLARKLKTSLPMQGGRGYSFTIERSLLPLQTPAILTEARIAVTPMGDKVRFGGTMEITHLDKPPDLQRVQNILADIPRYYPDFKPEWVDMNDIWHGFRPLSPDGLPYIGRHQNIENLTIAAGHAMMGMSLGPVTGLLVAELISGKDSSLNLTLMNPARFN